MLLILLLAAWLITLPVFFSFLRSRHPWSSMDNLRSAFNRMVRVKSMELVVGGTETHFSVRASTVVLLLQINNGRYSRFTLQPTEDGGRHAEVNLCDDSAEADYQPDGSPSFRPVPLHQNWLHLCLFVLGLLLMFVIGRIIVWLCTAEVYS